VLLYLVRIQLLLKSVLKEKTLKQYKLPELSKLSAEKVFERLSEIIS
jgi:hypothetical protein